MRPIGNWPSLRGPGVREKRCWPLCRWRPPALARHLGWARAIIAKFLRQMPGAQPNGFIHARVTRPCNLFHQYFLFQAWLNQPRGQAATEISKALLPLSRPHDPHSVRQPFGILEQVLAKSIRSQSVATWPASAFRESEARRVSFSAAGRHLNVVQFKQAPGGLRSLEPIHTLAAAMLDAISFPHKRGFARARFAQYESEEGQPNTCDVVKHIATKHRRVEERLVLDGQGLALGTTRIPGAEMTLVDNSPRVTRRPVHQPIIPIESGNRLSRPQPIVDVAQITDEVVKQLDRRLIAARERRGRI